MKLISGLLLLSLVSLQAGEDWSVIFDGSGFDGWKSNEENPGVFTITDEGELKVEGGRAHLFWVGTEEIPAEYEDFEFTTFIKTTPNSNSGIFFHTKYQETGWPETGLEAQVNSTHKDRRKTGSIWNKSDVLDDAPSADGEWCQYTIRVEGDTVTTLIDGEVVNVYKEPADVKPPKGKPNIRLGKGTFAIQGHDPKSITYFKDIKVRELD